MVRQTNAKVGFRDFWMHELHVNSDDRPWALDTNLEEYLDVSFTIANLLIENDTSFNLYYDGFLYVVSKSPKSNELFVTTVTLSTAGNTDTFIMSTDKFNNLCVKRVNINFP